jgi:hypothetical protein
MSLVLAQVEHYQIILICLFNKCCGKNRVK